MTFKVNCQRCGDILSKGKIFNYRDEIFCEDCYILYYLLCRESPKVKA